jgi:hypothetical protein
MVFPPAYSQARPTRPLTASCPRRNLGGWDHIRVGGLLVLTVTCGSCGAQLAVPDGLGESVCKCVRCGAVFAAPLREAPVAAGRTPATPVLVATQPLDPSRQTALQPQKPVAVQKKPRFNLVLWAAVGLGLALLVSHVLGRYQLSAVEESRLATAKGQLRWLTELCDDYKANNGRLPPSLAALAQQQPNGGNPLVEPDRLLVDPWDQPYGYDPSGPRNGGLHADIWVNLHANIWVNRPGGQVGNWEILATIEGKRLATAKGELRMLTRVCDDYNRNNGRFPPDLQALAHQQPNGARRLVQPDDLQDPWGQPYGYDPGGPRNGGLHPDIWVNQPGGQVTGNWDVDQ